MIGDVRPWFVACALLACGPAHASTPEDPPGIPGGPSGVAPTVHAVPAGPSGVGPVASVAVDPEDPSRQLVATPDGAVWQTVDGGRGWRRVLGPVAGHRGERDDPAADVEEPVAPPEPPDPDDFELDVEAFEEAWEAWGDEIAELEREAGARARRAGLEEGAPSPEPRVIVSRRGGRVVVGRRDGMWISDDDGRSWRGGPELGPITALRAEPDGVLLGTPEGAWWAADGAARPERITVGAVSAVARHGPAVLVGGEGGLFAVREGQSPVTLVDEPVLDVVSAGEAAWAVGRGRVFRVRGGEAERLDAPPGGLVAIAVVGERLVGAGPLGVWRAAGPMGGWTRVDGIRSATSVDAGGDVALLGGAGGAWTLVEGAPPRRVDEALHAHVDAVLREEARWWRWLAPKGAGLWPDVTLDLAVDTRDTFVWVPQAGVTRRLTGAWGVGLRLDWSPTTRRSAPRAVAGAAPLPVGRSHPNTVARRVVERRSDRVERILALGAHRATWAEIQRTLPADALLDRTIAHLRIQEIDAQIAALSGSGWAGPRSR